MTLLIALVLLSSFQFFFVLLFVLQNSKSGVKQNLVIKKRLKGEKGSQGHAWDILDKPKMCPRCAQVMPKIFL